MEKEQAEFLAKESAFRSPDYKWPRDPLHTWSRVWEYPYAYEHLSAMRSADQAGSMPVVVDLGSGVTFFPFSVARLGYRVVCTDVDPVCGKDILRAEKAVSVSPGSVSWKATNGQELPFENNSVDGIYCVSVLEHIPSFDVTVKEMARILKPGSMLILTIDIDLIGNKEIGPAKYRVLKRLLDNQFEYVHFPATVHPLDMLNSTTGPFRFIEPNFAEKAMFRTKNMIKLLLARRRAKPPWPVSRLAVEGMVYKKR